MRSASVKRRPETSSMALRLRRISATSAVRLGRSARPTVRSVRRLSRIPHRRLSRLPAARQLLCDRLRPMRRVQRQHESHQRVQEQPHGEQRHEPEAERRIRHLCQSLKAHMQAFSGLMGGGGEVAELEEKGRGGKQTSCH